MVLVSVIMSLYNHVQFVSEAIESVLNQTFKDFELIIIDDCSTDGSRQIIEKYKIKDNRIKIILHKENKGIAETTNDGLDMAKGKFIAFLDSDDVWEEIKLEEQLKVLKKNEDLIVWTEGEVIDKSSNPVGQTFTKMHYAIKRKKSGNIFNTLLLNNLIFKSSLILKKKNVGKIRFNNKLKILDDYQFEISLSRKYTYYFINKALTKYRRHEKNVTYAKKTQMRDYIKLRSYLLKKYDKIIIKSIKWQLNLDIINYYYEFGEMKKASSYIYNLINLYSYDPLTYWYYAKSLIKSNVILKILHSLLKFYQNLTIFRIQCINRIFSEGNSFFYLFKHFRSLGGIFFNHLFFLGKLWELRESS